MSAGYFGALRMLALYELWRSSGEHAYYIRDDQGIAGYIMVHTGSNAIQIGPWIANDGAVAEQLLKTVLQAFRECNILLDLPCPNGEGLKLMEKYRLPNPKRLFSNLLRRESFTRKSRSYLCNFRTRKGVNELNDGSNKPPRLEDARSVEDIHAMRFRAIWRNTPRSSPQEKSALVS